MCYRESFWMKLCCCVCGTRLLKNYSFFFFPQHLSKICWPRTNFLNTSSQSILVMCMLSSYWYHFFLLPFQFDFLSTLDISPQVRSWLRECFGCAEQDLDLGGSCPAGRYRLAVVWWAGNCATSCTPTQKEMHASHLQDQAFRVKTSLLSDLWGLQHTLRHHRI